MIRRLAIALLVVAWGLPAAASKPVTTATPFDLAWFKNTDAYASLVAQLGRSDPSVPGVKLDVVALDALLADVKVTERDIEWVRRYASPVSRKKQRKRVRSVMHILLSKSRVDEGRRFATVHRAVLDEVSQRYGVTVADLVSMMNAESRFGKAQGDFRVAGVFVANLAYIEAAEREAAAGGKYKLDGAMSRSRNKKRVLKRRRYAASNLLTTLRYAKSRKLDPMAMTGSWAGAIGITQFMPASLRWAKDGDGDGVVDLSTVPDAVASTANYLVQHGYVLGDLEARKQAFHAYNPNREYVKAIVAYSERFARDSLGH